MIGLDGAGKSTILERIKYIFKKDGGGGGDGSGAITADKEKEILLGLSKITPTVGLNIGRLEIRGANVIVWDLGGDAGLRGIWDKYYADAHAVRYSHLLLPISRVLAPGRNHTLAPHFSFEVAAA
jgi:ADP-ribosylation factor related protein 1